MKQKGLLGSKKRSKDYNKEKQKSRKLYIENGANFVDLGDEVVQLDDLKEFIINYLEKIHLLIKKGQYNSSEWLYNILTL